MNVYEKLKTVENNIDDNIKKAYNLAKGSYSCNTNVIIEKLLKINISTAKLIIEKQKLLKIINRLSKKDKDLLEYKYHIYPNLSGEEIAKKLGMSKRTYFRRLENLNIYKEDIC